MYVNKNNHKGIRTEHDVDGTKYVRNTNKSCHTHWDIWMSFEGAFTWRTRHTDLYTLYLSPWNKS